MGTMHVFIVVFASFVAAVCDLDIHRSSPIQLWGYHRRIHRHKLVWFTYHHIANACTWDNKYSNNNSSINSSNKCNCVADLVDRRSHYSAAGTSGAACCHSP
ncbi:hypothetical protein HETIRDRAFT_163365 [Heterobasidion irregulare TC 32-1]|uniref:Secreted protein n=1 Tax=Heterobasidion irregulare (strain TC 32-1) TaxID=747525 RepID=W4KC93_HETIT|nr:uncharacterized protein HETIRDRAFT_163365 [Heterobasidion irregulare TC 32-1]ETW82960.1 hypothetical protein HETIRDRAFT_163365 [Heterobasidion irregulare TC 32-1]